MQETDANNFNNTIKVFEKFIDSIGRHILSDRGILMI